MKNDIIVILCGTFNEQKIVFKSFIDYLEKIEPESIIKIDRFSYSVKTYYNICYYFTTYRMNKFLKNIKREDIADVYDFMEGIY